MKVGIEAFVSMVMIIMMVMLGVSYYAAELNTANARSYQAAIVDQIEASHFSQQVIDCCITEAAEAGYEVTVRDLTIYEDRKDMVVSLTYLYEIPILGVASEHVIEGYAR